MIRAHSYLNSVLETDLSQDALASAGSVQEIAQAGGDVLFSASLLNKKPLPGGFYFDANAGESAERLFFRLRFYNHGIVRLLISARPQEFTDHSVMLKWDPALRRVPARLTEEADRWQITGEPGAFFSVGRGKFSLDFSPDGRVPLRFQNEDRFMPDLQDALPAVLLRRRDGSSLTGFALHIPPGEHFCGTGERFERPDLYGEQVDLVNVDAAGVNNPRSYKNIPLLLSSRGYGIFAPSPAKMRLDIGAHSTRSLHCPLARLPLFVRAGSSVTFTEPVAHTGLLDQARKVTITFDENYPGFAGSALREWVEL